MSATFTPHQMGPFGRGFGLLMGLGLGFLALHLARLSTDPDRVRALKMSESTSINGATVNKGEITDVDEKAGLVRLGSAMATLAASLGFLAAFGASHPKRKGAGISLFSAGYVRNWAEKDRPYLERAAGSVENLGGLGTVPSPPVFREQALTTVLVGLGGISICVGFIMSGVTLIGTLILAAVATLCAWLGISGVRALRSPLGTSRIGPHASLTPGARVVVPVEVVCKPRARAVIDELRFDVIAVRWHQAEVERARGQRRERTTLNVPEVVHDLWFPPIATRVELEPGERRTFPAQLDIPAEPADDRRLEWIATVSCTLADGSTHNDDFVLIPRGTTSDRSAPPPAHRVARAGGRKPRPAAEK